MSKSKYVEMEHGATFVVESGKRETLACSCGLVHDLTIETQDGKPAYLTTWDNKRSTAAMRREMKEKASG